MQNLQVVLSPRDLTRFLEEQQRAAVLKWVADPFGNYVKIFPVSLPSNVRVEHMGRIKNWGDEPFPICLRIHEVKAPKTAPARAARLPDGGVVHGSGKWVWGAGNEPESVDP